VTERDVNAADKAERSEEKNPVDDVELVMFAFVPKMLVDVIPVADAVERFVCPFTTNVPADERLDVDALPSVVCPVTPSVPPTVWLPVIVEVPTVCVFAVRLVITAFVVVELATIKLVRLAKVAARVVKNPFDVVLFVMNALVE